MKSIIKAFIALLICMFTFAGLAWEGNDNIMLWQVTGTENTVDDGPNDVYTFFGFDHSDDELGVRIACYDKYGNLVKYLNPVYGGEYGIDWEYNDEYLGTRDELPTAHMPGRQAYYGPLDYMEYLFQMQVGNYDSDFNFSPLLYSHSESVDGKYWYDAGQLAPQYGEWLPTSFYTINPVVPISPVPEPNSGILLLMDLGFLGLKRKSA